MNFNHPLKKIITDKKSIELLANKIGISSRMLYYYINLEKYPSRKTAKKISTVTGIPVTDLLYPENDDA